MSFGEGSGTEHQVQCHLPSHWHSTRQAPVFHTVFTFCSLTVTLTMRSSAVYCEVRPQGVMYTDSVLKWPCHVARLLNRRQGFRLGSVRVGCVVHEVAGIGAGFSPRTLVFSPRMNRVTACPHSRSAAHLDARRPLRVPFVLLCCLLTGP
jgi:hypothetical protein